MIRRIFTPRFWLASAAVIGLALLPFALPGSVLGEGHGDTPGAPAASTPGAGVADPLDRLPPGIVPATEHEAIVVPAGPEDPNAPALRYHDPEPTPEGDESANRPVPEYLKGDPYRLSFVTGDYRPPAHERIDPVVLENLDRYGRNYTYGYVMFEGALQARKVQALEDLGVVFGNYHTFNCMQALIPAQAIPGLTTSPFVRWVGTARPEQKVDQFILDALLDPTADPSEDLAVFLNVFESDLGAGSKPVPIDAVNTPVSSDPREINMRAMVMMSNGLFQQAIQTEGARVMGYEDSIRTFYVWANRPVLRRLMKLDFVAGMDMAFPPEPDHDRSMRMTTANYVGNQSSYCGKDTSVAICDSGFHHAHYDLSQAYSLGWDYSGESNPSVDNYGHGTHVACTVFGDGTARSDKRYRGSAPQTGTLPVHAVYKLKLFKSDGSGGANYPNYCPTAWTITTNTYSSWSTMTSKCTVIQNSWGSGNRLTTGYYGTDSLCRAADTNTLDEQQLYVMSSGNNGGNSVTEYLKSNRPPAVAKSAFAVGSLMDYDDTTGGYANRYPGAHRFSSSKGPTRDGRMKPQISAPGCMITSAKTNTTNDYTAKSGTSMSAPHASGVAAMMHDGNSTYRTYPCLCRAKMMAAAAPYAGTRTWTTTSESYYNRRGMGQLDAYTTMFSYSSANGWNSGYSARTLTRSSSGFYFDVAVPSDATRTFFVMSWDEKAPALNATAAVLYNFDLVLDVAPFDPDITKGEYSSRLVGENYDWYGNVGSISALRGKTVRVKVPFVTRPTSTTESVRVAVGYHIPRGDDTPTTTVDLTASPTMVKPGATITATARADVAAYRANNLYMTLSRGACTVTSLTHTTRDGRTLNTDTVVSGGYDSKENWTVGEAGFWWSASQRSLVWTLQAPSTSRVTTISATVRGDTSGSNTDSVVICVDGSVPSTPSNVKSTTHTPNTWSNQRAFTVNWAASSDTGCAGMAGYGAGLASSCPKIISRNLGNVTTYSTTLPSSSGATYYFAVKAYDKVGNGSGTTCVGPFLLDTTAPASGTISINNGASSTTSLVVTLNNLGASETGSGLYRMRFSNNGSTWSSWETYATSKTGWNLSAYGGNTSAGLKRTYVQYRDKAGNSSGSYSDTITYTVLDVTSVSPTSGTLIGDDLVTVYGQGFATGIRVYFDGVAATSVSVASSTRLTCRTPRHLVWERVDVRVTLGSATDTLLNGYEYVGANIQSSGDPQLGTLFPIVFSAPVDGSRSYVAAASFGKGPIPLPPHNDLRLTPDSLFYLTVANAIPTVFGGMRGTLNSGGQAKGTVVLPKIPAIVGLNFYMAFVTLDAGKPIGIRTVSEGKAFRISKD